MNDLTLTARKRLGNGLEDLVNNQQWMADASCAGLAFTDPDLADRMFFPANGTLTLGAQAMCNGCPVNVECGSYGVTDSLGHGVWGGDFGSLIYVEPVARAEEAA